MKKKISIALVGACAMIIASLSGCIKNDIPYPRIQASFTSFVVQNELTPAEIDSVSRTVTLNLSERANKAAVKVISYTLSQGSRMVSPDTLSTLNLETDYTVTLGYYQDYEWTISAKQTITRYFEAENQIGVAVIDLPGKRVVFTIPDNIDITAIHVDSIKLGPEGSVMVPDLNGKTVDFTLGVPVEVTAYGITDTWTIYADVSETTVFMREVDAWTRVAWVYVEAEAGKNNGIQYRRADISEWTDVPADWISTSGGNITGRLIHLDPMTEYAVRAYSDDEFTAETTFTTQQEAQMPNSSFNDWSLNGKIWQPWGEDQEPYWDTGNRGATILGSANVEPTDITSTGTGRAALLKTEFKGIGSLGKLAAGSIYAGYFVRTDGTNGVLSFGRPFEQRPTKLRGALKYHPEPISDATSGFEQMIGQPDTCIVWVALIDSEEPFEIRTNPSNRHLFDPEGDYVIAYGAVQYGYDVENYTEFTLTLDYKSTSRTPSYILCVCSSSKFGDYFTGGRGSMLYLDDFQLLFDY